jgi:hypothetical protein
VRGLGYDLVPPPHRREVPARRALEDQAFADHGADPLEPGAYGLEPLRVPAELELNVVVERRAVAGEVVEKRLVVATGGRDGRADERVEDPGGGVGEVERFAFVDLGQHAAATGGELKGPDPPGLGPEVEAAAAGIGGRLVACAEEAGQGAVGHAGEEPTVVEKRDGLVEGAESSVRRQPAKASPTRPVVLRQSRS